MVNSTIRELRKKAYEMWGIQPNAVIYNMPQKRLKPKQDFVFQINYSPEFRAWPKAYSLIVPNVCDLRRMIMPVIVVNSKLDLKWRAWYDMPFEIAEQIIDHVHSGKVFSRPLSWTKKVCNWFLPTDRKYLDIVDVEDYTFVVRRTLDNRFEVKLV